MTASGQEQVSKRLPTYTLLSCSNVLELRQCPLSLLMMMCARSIYPVSRTGLPKGGALCPVAQQSYHNTLSLSLSFLFQPLLFNIDVVCSRVMLLSFASHWTDMHNAFHRWIQNAKHERSNLPLETQLRIIRCAAEPRTHVTPRS